MSDAALRTLERRWKESGLVEDEAALLKARLRAGTLTQSRLELAAYANHEASQLLLPGLYDRTGQENDHITGICPCGWCMTDMGLVDWFGGGTTKPGLQAWDQERAVARAALGVAQGLMERTVASIKHVPMRPDCGCERCEAPVYLRCVQEFLDEPTPATTDALLSVHRKSDDVPGQAANASRHRFLTAWYRGLPGLVLLARQGAIKDWVYSVESELVVSDIVRDPTASAYRVVTSEQQGLLCGWARGALVSYALSEKTGG